MRGRHCGMTKRRPYEPELYGGRRRQLKARIRREEPNCWLCGYPVDLSLPPNHPMSSTVDEVIPRSRSVDRQRAALDRDNCRHAHRACNSAKGDRLVEEERYSREW